MVLAMNGLRARSINSFTNSVAVRAAVAFDNLIITITITERDFLITFTTCDFTLCVLDENVSALKEVTRTNQ